MTDHWLPTIRILREKLIRYFFSSTDNSPLIVFRVIFGFLVTCESWGAIATGWVERSFIIPDYTFPFIDFMWLKPLPGYGMYAYFTLMGIAGICIMLGYRYRVAIGTFAVMWSTVYFMQKTNYNNHYYLLMLLSFMMCSVPANKYYALDVKQGRVKQALTCPAWCIRLFAIAMSVVYFYASIAKMYEGWLNLEPISIWFAGKSHYYVIGSLLTQRWFQVLVAYGSIVFDLFMSVGLLWKPTRKYAFALSVGFHLFNSAVFHVGIFPFLGIAIGVFYFDPQKVQALFFRQKPPVAPTLPPSEKRTTHTWQLGIFIILIAAHALIPLRHHLFPGDVLWTEEGHRLSWRMMLRIKRGYVNVNVVDNDTGETYKINKSDYLTPKQSHMVACRPDMMWQFVQLLKKDFRAKGIENLSVFLEGKVKVNKGPYRTLYDPDYDMDKAEWHRFRSSEWLITYRD